MNIRLLLYGVCVALLWNAEGASTVLLTTTLMTGFVGGYLIGRLPLGTFLGVLSTNGTNLQPPSLPQIPSVNLSSIFPSFPTLIPRGENKNVAAEVPASDISDTSTTSLPATTTSSPVSNSPPSPPNMPQIYTYNYPIAYPYPMQTYSYAAPTTARPSIGETLKFSLEPIKPIDVPISLDNKIRDRFIRQLAIMDPLHCLPKIFCEVSADPYGATFLMNYGYVNNVGPLDQSTVTKEEIMAYEHHLHRQRLRTTTPRPPPPPTYSTTITTEAPPQNDEDDDQADSHSASEEEEEEEDDTSTSAENDSDEEDDDSFEAYRKEHEHKIEMQALEEMVDETEDPETYMFILRDKLRGKTARKRYREKQRKKKIPPRPMGQGSTFRREDIMAPDIQNNPLEYRSTYNPSGFNDEPSSAFLNRRISADPPLPPPPMEPPTFMPPIFMHTTESSMHDMFADDPFFDDFPNSSGRSARTIGRGFKSHSRRKRVKRQAFNKADLMRMFRLAYMVAEKYRSPDVCSKTFPSCPYRAETIMSVVNRMESGLLPFKLSSDKKNFFGNKNNIFQFKNTLQAIERLNQATLHAQARGEPLDIDKVTEYASNPTAKFEANTSENIVNEFRQVVANIKSATTKKRKKHKRRKTVKNQTKYDAVHYYKKAQMETLKPKQRVKMGVFHKKEPVRQQDDEVQTHQQWGGVPSFKQTYKEMFKTSKQQKSRPNNENRRKVTKSKSTSAQSREEVRPIAKPVRKFAEVTEDDEKDAKESEEAINALIFHGKHLES